MTAKEEEGQNSSTAQERSWIDDEISLGAPKELQKFDNAIKLYLNALTSLHRTADFLARFIPGPMLESAVYERFRAYETKLDQTLEALFCRVPKNTSPTERAKTARFLGATAALRLSFKLPKIQNGQALDSVNLTIRRMIIFGVQETKKATGETIDRNYANDLIGELIDPESHTTQSLVNRIRKAAMFVEKPLLLEH